MKTLKELGESLKAKRDEAKALFDKLATEGPEAGKSRPPTDEELAQIKALDNECRELEKQIETHHTLDGSRKTLERVDALLSLPTQQMPGKGSMYSAKTLYDIAAENDDFDAWYKDVKRGSYKAGDFLLDTKAALIRIGGSTSAGELTIPMQTGIIDNPFLKRIVLRDVVTTSPCDTDSYEYVRITSFDNQAAEVAEASSVSGTSGTKPTSSVTFQRIQEHIQDIAHLMHTTNKALQDAGELQTLLNVYGINGVESRLQYQMIRGDGSAPNLRGVLNTPNIQTQTFASSIVETALRAQTAVTLDFDDIDGDDGGGAEPTAYVMNPLDWQEFQLARDEEGRFYWGGPSVIGPRSLWSLPVITTQAVPRGRPIVADWRFARLWDRQQIIVRFFEQNRDYAERNMVLVRAEGRFGFGLIRPQAFVEFEMEAASA